MGDYESQFVGAAVGKALFPILIAIVLALLVWIGRNTLNDEWGERLFGKYWYRRDQEALREQAAQRAASWLRELGYWLGQQTGRLIRRK